MTSNGQQSGTPLRAGDPRELDGYRIVSRLGRGGMGTVYLARDASDRPVAVKLIRPDLADDESFRLRFAREVQAARRVARFSTAGVIDARLEGDPLFIVSEYVAGPNLDEQVRADGPMIGGTLESLALGVAAALTAIHGSGVIHRDLKPANVLLSTVGPKVIDFGIARALDGTDGGVTRSSELIGTPSYLAPELLDGHRAGPEADIFAWGCLIAFAGTGTAPFDAATVPAVLHNITSAPPRLDGLDPSLHTLVAAALDKTPENRPTAKQILARLTGQEDPGEAEVRRTISTSWAPPSTPPVPGAAPDREPPEPAGGTPPPHANAPETATSQAPHSVTETVPHDREGGSAHAGTGGSDRQEGFPGGTTPPGTTPPSDPHGAYGVDPTAQLPWTPPAAQDPTQTPPTRFPPPHGQPPTYPPPGAQVPARSGQPPHVPGSGPQHSVHQGGHPLSQGPGAAPGHQGASGGYPPPGNHLPGHTPSGGQHGFGAHPGAGGPGGPSGPGQPPHDPRGNGAPPPRREPRRRNGRLWAVGGGALALVVIAGVGGYALLAGGDAPPQNTEEIYGENFAIDPDWSNGVYDPEDERDDGYWADRGMLLMLDPEDQPSRGEVAPIDAELPDSVLVTATAHVVEGPGQAMFGVRCWDNRDRRGEGPRSMYEALLRHDGQQAEIRRVIMGGDDPVTESLDETFDVPGYEPYPLYADGRGAQGADEADPYDIGPDDPLVTNTVMFACEYSDEGDEETMRLRMWVNGELAAEAVDDDPLPDDAEEPEDRHRVGVVLRGGFGSAPLGVLYTHFSVREILPGG
ncbi:serine/threonine-protein kinase [Nocardiopsis sp. FIRDI 009]|uniref:serine/threonine-protein kinase n=1 Tax=Nocardiopsis sp. FIRDI 009 TaxID=714197 RepID=UPI000E24B563|nr:serine/threonine-protein kinase [Nocardiopsis sp. FIRDI 009]